jgi:hypothetical protein
MWFLPLLIGAGAGAARGVSKGEDAEGILKNSLGGAALGLGAGAGLTAMGVGAGAAGGAGGAATAAAPTAVGGAASGASGAAGVASAVAPSGWGAFSAANPFTAKMAEGAATSVATQGAVKAATPEVTSKNPDRSVVMAPQQLMSAEEMMKLSPQQRDQLMMMSQFGGGM